MRKKGPAGKNLRDFPLETLKNFILNEKLYPSMTTIRAFFLQVKPLFSNFRKRAGETSPPLPPSSYASGLKPKRRRVKNFNPIGSNILYTLLSRGRMNDNSLLLNTEIGSEFLTVSSNLYQSFRVEEKKEFLKQSA